MSESTDRDVTVRPLGADEWDLWCQLRIAALTDAPDAFTARLSEWSSIGLPRWRERFETRTAYNLVAERANQPIGLVSGLIVSADECQLRSLWVNPIARGSGAAGLLVESIVEWARQQGAIALSLRVIADNTRAIDFYRRHGFVETGDGGGDLVDRSPRELAMTRPIRGA